jgi:hypothetical protein
MLNILTYEQTFQFSVNSIVQEKMYTPSSLYHYSRLNRKQDVEKKRKQKKLAWIRKLYTVGKNGKEEKSERLELTRGLDVATSINALQIGEENVDDIVQGLESMDLDHSLLTWTDALNFDEYQSSWLSLATTAPSILGNP